MCFRKLTGRHTRRRMRSNSPVAELRSGIRGIRRFRNSAINAALRTLCLRLQDAFVDRICPARGKTALFSPLISGGKLYLAGNFKGEEVGILAIDTGNWLRPRGAALLKALVSNKKHSLTFYSPCLRIVSTYFFFSLFLSFSFYRHIPFPRFPTCEQQREFDRIAISEFVQSNYTLFFYASMSLSILIRQVLSFFFIVRVRTCGWIDKRREAEV